MKRIKVWLSVALSASIICGCSTSADTDISHKQSRADSVPTASHQSLKLQHAVASSPSLEKNYKLRSSNTKQSNKQNFSTRGSINQKKGALELNIGLLVPTPDSSVGISQSMVDAAQLALKELGNDQVNLVILNGGTTAETASRALESAEVRLDAIIGPYFYKQVSAVSQYAQAKNIPCIALAHSSRPQAFANTFNLGLATDSHIDKLLSYAVTKKVKKVYALLPDDDDGLAVEQLLAKYKKNNQISGSFIARYRTENNAENSLANSADLSSALAQLQKALQINGRSGAVLLLPQSGATLNEVLNHIRNTSYLDIKSLKILCGSKFHNTSEHIKDWSSAWLADVALSDRDNFTSRFRNIYRYEPQYIAPVAYDAIALLLSIAEIDTTSKYLKFNLALLKDKRGFQGVNGIFRFESDGSCTRGLSIFKLELGQPVEVERSPLSFL